MGRYSVEPNDRLALLDLEYHARKLLEYCRDLRCTGDHAYADACGGLITDRLDKLKGVRRVLVKRGTLSGSNPRVVKAAVIDLEHRMK